LFRKSRNTGANGAGFGQWARKFTPIPQNPPAKGARF
jgi:hypothetical protein